MRWKPSTHLRYESCGAPGGKLPEKTASDAFWLHLLRMAVSLVTSWAVISGPSSLSSVTIIRCGSTILRQVRDSPMTMAKSVPTPLRSRPILMVLPVSPPMKPVATTGCPNALRTRATLMPLPPGNAGMFLTSLTALSEKPDTTAVRSMAALGVTVTITGAPGR
ncbi:hypothetical protein D3C86_1407450 [compost metagenome]